MKLRLSGIGLCLLLLTVVWLGRPVHGQTTTNLLVNPSFELLDAGTDHPTGWSGGHSKNTSWLEVPDGTNYGYVTGSEEMSQTVPVNVGSGYLLSFWSGTHVVRGQYVEMRLLDSVGNTVDAVRTLITHSVDENHKLEGVYYMDYASIPEGAVSIQVLISANGYGWAKVDAMSLQEITPVVETATPTRPETQTTPTATIATPPTSVITPTLPAKVIFVKDAQPKTDTDFTFYMDGYGEFQLDDPLYNDGDEIGNRIEITVAPGTYSIRELPTEGWELEGIVCNKSMAVDVQSASVGVVLEEGQVLTCMFSNRTVPSVLEETDEPAMSNHTYLPLVSGGGYLTKCLFVGNPYLWLDVYLAIYVDAPQNAPYYLYSGNELLGMFFDAETYYIGETHQLTYPLYVKQNRTTQCILETMPEPQQK